MSDGIHMHRTHYCYVLKKYFFLQRLFLVTTTKKDNDKKGQRQSLQRLLFITATFVYYSDFCLIKENLHRRLHLDMSLSIVTISSAKGFFLYYIPSTITSMHI